MLQKITKEIGMELNVGATSDTSSLEKLSKSLHFNFSVSVSDSDEKK